MSVAYYRVSTQRQGQSGLGLDAQRQAVRAYLQAAPDHEFTDVESGSHNDRPALREAMDLCRLTGQKLIIAKLDRLSRDAAFLLALRDSGLEFVCCDMPDANRLTVGLLAVIAEHERELISQRTKAALEQAKLRGVKLGNPNGAAALRRSEAKRVEAVRAKASRRDRQLAHVLRGLEALGITSCRGIAENLEFQGIPGPRGGAWHPSAVARLKQRLQEGVEA